MNFKNHDTELAKLYNINAPPPLKNQPVGLNQEFVVNENNDQGPIRMNNVNNTFPVITKAHRDFQELLQKFHGVDRDAPLRKAIISSLTKTPRKVQYALDTLGHVYDRTHKDIQRAFLSSKDTTLLYVFYIGKSSFNRNTFELTKDPSVLSLLQTQFKLQPSIKAILSAPKVRKQRWLKEFVPLTDKERAMMEDEDTAFEFLIDSKEITKDEINQMYSMAVLLNKNKVKAVLKKELNKEPLKANGPKRAPKRPVIRKK